MFKKADVRWEQPSLTGAPGSPVEFWHQQPGRASELYVLSEGLIQALTHWNNGRSFPCIGIANGCFGCRLSMNWRRRSYLAVACSPNRRAYLLELTDKAKEFCPALVKESGLRGKLLEVRRKTLHHCSTLQCKILPRICPAAALPDCPDVMEVLYKIWTGTGRKQLPRQADGSIISSQADETLFEV